MLCSAKELVEASNRPRRPGIYTYRQANDNFHLEVVNNSMTITQAKNMLRNIRLATLANRQSKATRPWEVAKVTDQLDPNEIWIGFELETGFNLKAPYEKAFNYIWRHLRYVAFDREGSGHYPVEITFPPQELSTFKKDKASIQRFLSYAAKEKLEFAEQGVMSGTHANISTPTFRKLDAQRATAALGLVNHVIRDLLTGEGKLRLFGRAQPYGYGFYQGDGLGSQWVEFKLFRSFNDLKIVNAYTAVAERLAHLLDYAVDKNTADVSTTNAMVAYIKGETNELK